MNNHRSAIYAGYASNRSGRTDGGDISFYPLRRVTPLILQRSKSYEAKAWRFSSVESASNNWIVGTTSEVLKILYTEIFRVELNPLPPLTGDFLVENFQNIWNLSKIFIAIFTRKQHLQQCPSHRLDEKFWRREFGNLWHVPFCGSRYSRLLRVRER